MRPSEAQWIADAVARLGTDACSPLLNVGSSTAEFRERRQPHIEQLVFGPLRRAAVRVLHSDIKDGVGVDVVGDLMDPSVQARIRAHGPRTVLCSNLLEHVEDPHRFAAAITELVVGGAHIVVTVPHSYPFHADPIDTGFRPTPRELAGLFPGTTLERGEIVEDTTYAHELRTWPLRRSVRALLGALRPFGTSGRARRDRLRWMFRRFSTTCVVLRRS